MTMHGDDWAELAELPHRFAWAVDFDEWDELRESLDDEVLFDPGAAWDRPPVPRTAGELVGMLQGGGLYSAKEHLVGNVVVRVNGDEAVVRAYVHFTGVIEDLTPPLWRMGGTYRFTARRTPQGWRTTGMTIRRSWSEGNDEVPKVAAQRRAAAAATAAGA